MFYFSASKVKAVKYMHFFSLIWPAYKNDYSVNDDIYIVDIINAEAWVNQITDF